MKTKPATKKSVKPAVKKDVKKVVKKVDKKKATKPVSKKAKVQSHPVRDKIIEALAHIPKENRGVSKATVEQIRALHLSFKQLTGKAREKAVVAAKAMREKHGLSILGFQTLEYKYKLRAPRA